MDAATSIGVKTTMRQAVIVSSISVVYLCLSIFLVGFKSEQVIVIGIFNLLFYLSDITRKFILGFSIFLVYWTVFDYMKALPNYLVNTVHIADIYQLEKHLFGIRYNGVLLTPNEYWRVNGNTFLDIAGGIFYLCWVPVPIAFAIFLFFKNREQFLYFSLTFVLVNFIGFAIYYIFPAAPPWYVEYHGFHFYANTPGNTAGLVKFDNYFHVGIFKSIYAKSSNVFAAMPSLHSAYPVIVLYYSVKNKYRVMNIFFTLVMLGIWFTAIYASHHYILDVIAGIVCAVGSILLFNASLIYIKFFRTFVANYYQTIQ